MSPHGVAMVLAREITSCVLKHVAALLDLAAPVVVVINRGHLLPESLEQSLSAVSAVDYAKPDEVFFDVIRAAPVASIHEEQASVVGSALAERIGVPHHCFGAPRQASAAVTSSPTQANRIVFIEASATGAGEKTLLWCKNNGIETVLFSRRLSSYPQSLLELADRVYETDTTCSATLTFAFADVHASETVAGVTTTADFFVPMAAYVADTFALPSISYGAAMATRNKFALRTLLDRDYSALNPPFDLAKTADEAHDFAESHGYPIVAKPIDANDSLHVRQLNCKAAVVAYFDQASAWLGKPMVDSGLTFKNAVLLEGLVDGPEFSVETFHCGHGAQFLACAQKDLFLSTTNGGFTEGIISMPVDHACAQLLFAQIAPALNALGIKQGVVHTECRLVGDQVKIIEVNPRLAGDMLGSHVIEMVTGVDACALVAQTALGQKPTIAPVTRGGGAIVGLHATRSGKFAAVANLNDLQSMDGFHAATIWTETGAPVGPPQSNADLVGRIVVAGCNRQQAESRARDFYQKTQVEIF